MSNKDDEIPYYIEPSNDSGNGNLVLSDFKTDPNKVKVKETRKPIGFSGTLSVVSFTR